MTVGMRRIVGTISVRFLTKIQHINDVELKYFEIPHPSVPCVVRVVRVSFRGAVV